MTKNELLSMITEGATVTAEMAEKAAALLATDAAAREKRKGKVSVKTQAKRDENEALAKHIVDTILKADPMTATDVTAVLTAETGEAIKVQKTSYLCRLAVKMGLANETEVKIPSKGTQKGYSKI